MEGNKEEDTIDSKYIILKQISKGYTSEVFKVREIDSNNIYAAKVFINAYKFFQKEVDILNLIKKLNNPYLISIINSGIGTVIWKGQVQQNKQYIIFDYASKGELDKYLFINNTPLPELHAKFIFFKILKGVEAFHNAVICHRDLKMKNILLDDSFTPKICDFGFATENNGHLHEFLGTFSYASPEIYYGKPYDGFKADIFSLGVILLKLTACKFGFKKAVYSDEKYIKIMRKTYESFWTSIVGTENLSKELKCLYVKMVSFFPKERPTIEEIFQSDWLKEIRGMKDEKLKELENEVREEFLKRESILNDAKKKNKEINNNNNNSSSSIQNKSLKNDDSIFNPNSKPRYAKTDLNMDYCIKITGNFDPAKFMNDLVAKIKNLYECFIDANKDKFKFNAVFEKEEEYYEVTEDMKEELKKYGITEDEIKNMNNDNENIKGKRTVIQIKLFESDNGEYLLRFVKKEGELSDYMELIDKIYSLVLKM